MLHRLPPLPDIPGGWTTIPFDLTWRQLELIVPAAPDRLLDDPEVLEANRRDDYMPYWSSLWPAAPPFARALDRAPWPSGTEVLDLGSGVGTTGLARLARGDRVVFSDYDPQSLLVCRHNAVRNGLPDPETLLLDWRRPLDRTFPVILGCEVTYEQRNHQPLLGLLDRMLAPSAWGPLTGDGAAMGTPLAWIADPGRFYAPKFYELARARSYRVRVLDESLAEQPGPRANVFQIMELMRPASRP